MCGVCVSALFLYHVHRKTVKRHPGATHVRPAFCSVSWACVFYFSCFFLFLFFSLSSRKLRKKTRQHRRIIVLLRMFVVPSKKNCKNRRPGQQTHERPSTLFGLVSVLVSLPWTKVDLVIQWNLSLNCWTPAVLAAAEPISLYFWYMQAAKGFLRRTHVNIGVLPQPMPSSQIILFENHFMWTYLLVVVDYQVLLWKCYLLLRCLDTPTQVKFAFFASRFMWKNAKTPCLWSVWYRYWTYYEYCCCCLVTQTPVELSFLWDVTYNC